MQFEKRHLLIVIAVGCLILYYYGSQQNIPYTDYLPMIGGGAYALNFIANLAKQ